MSNVQPVSKEVKDILEQIVGKEMAESMSISDAMNLVNMLTDYQKVVNPIVASLVDALKSNHSHEYKILNDATKDEMNIYKIGMEKAETPEEREQYADRAKKASEEAYERTKELKDKNTKIFTEKIAYIPGLLLVGLTAAQLFIRIRR